MSPESYLSDNRPIRAEIGTKKCQDTSVDMAAVQKPQFVESESLQAPGSVFPLMKLPAELRLHIYRSAMVRPYPIVLHKELPAPPPSSRKPDSQTAFDIDEQYLSSDEDQLSTLAHQEGPAFTSPADRAFATAVFIPSQSVPATNTQQQAGPRRISRLPLPQDQDPLNPAILRLSQTIYKEARQILYGENIFDLRFDSAVHTICSLHQQARSLIRHVRLLIPSPADIQDEFGNILRLGLRYCWGLKIFTIIIPFRLINNDGAGAGNSLSGLSSLHMYANAFNLLRWLPKTTEVVVEGDVCDEIRGVIAQNATFAKSLDAKAYAKRQHQISDSRSD